MYFGPIDDGFVFTAASIFDQAMSRLRVGETEEDAPGNLG